MAKLLLTQFSTPLLVAILFQMSTITLALQCYGCLDMDSKAIDPTSYPHCDSSLDDLIVDQSDRNSLFKKGANELREELINSEVKLTRGPFCMEIVNWEDGATSPILFRYIVPQAPEKKSLDEFGCYDGNEGRYCFCKEDLCNLDITDQDSSEEEVADEGGHDGHETPSEGNGNRPTHGHGHKPKRPPGKKPKSEGKKSFVDKISSFFSNSALSFTTPNLLLLIIPSLIICYIARQ